MRGVEEVAEVLSRIDDSRLILDFLKCILTPYELEEVSGRWELVKLLERGVSQRRISERLGMSLCKITRGSRELKKQDSAFKRVLSQYLGGPADRGSPAGRRISRNKRPETTK